MKGFSNMSRRSEIFAGVHHALKVHAFVVNEYFDKTRMNTQGRDRIESNAPWRPPVRDAGISRDIAISVPAQ